jgi:hypothetical protein
MSIMTTSVLYSSAYLLVVFSSFFLTAILPLSPVYISFFLSLCFILVVGKYRRIPSKCILVYAPFFLYLIYMIFSGIYLDDSLKRCLILAYFSLVYVVGDFILYQISQKQLKVIIKNYLFFNALLMIADLLYRLYNGIMTADQYIYSNPLYKFYIFKDTSLLHMDSNGTGFIVLIILTVLVYLKNINNTIFIKKMHVLFLILLVLSFSRSCIIAYICLQLFIYLFVKRNLYFKLFMLAIGIFSAYTY